MAAGVSNSTRSANPWAGMWTDARLLGHWPERRSRDMGGWRMRSGHLVWGTQPDHKVARCVGSKSTCPLLFTHDLSASVDTARSSSTAGASGFALLRYIHTRRRGGGKVGIPLRDFQ